MADQVILQVNGKNYSGWQTIRVTLGMEQLSGCFDLTITERWPNQPAARQILIGDACRLLIGKEVVITGYVDDVDPSYDATSHTVKITGRDKAGDLIDCSATHREWHNASLATIAADICKPFGITVIVAADLGSKFGTFAVYHAEHAFETLDRACRMRGILPLSDGKGNLLLTRAGAEKIKTPLIKGKNIERATGKHSLKERHSSYIVKGQSPPPTWATDQQQDLETHLQVKADIADPGVTRYRPLIIIAEPGDHTTYKDRAVWEKNVRYGRGNRVSYTVSGWRHADGLWLPNRLVDVKDDFQGIDGEMIISGAEFGLTEEAGGTTVIEVTRPEAFALISLPDKHKKKKTESLVW